MTVHTSEKSCLEERDAELVNFAEGKGRGHVRILRPVPLRGRLSSHHQAYISITT